VTSATVATDTTDAALRQRALAVVPGGMYGHMNAGRFPAEFPQFYARAAGCRTWDVDGRGYLDYLCAFGPMVLGYGNPVVEGAADRQRAEGDCMSGPSARFVELAELFVDTVPAADWAMFAKNGTDATTTCLTIARAATGRRTVLAASGSYHGAAPWCTPRTAGVTPADRVNLGYFGYNDLASVQRAVDGAEGDVAAVIVTPFRHEIRAEQQPVDPAFARGVRELCTRIGAVLVLDDVRAGMRLHVGGSWEPLGVRPDLSAWSKAIANGHSLAAITGTDALREAAREVYTTGSFWFGAVAMAAAIATITEIRRVDAPARIGRVGELLRTGLLAQAQRYGLQVNHSGPPQMPLLTFASDPDFVVADAWTTECLRRGALFHPWHNGFLSTAHTEDDIAATLEITDRAFEAVSRG
jgi:glutamate-1-semialdehyde 2,1-aminomutase